MPARTLLINGLASNIHMRTQQMALHIQPLRKKTTVHSPKHQNYSIKENASILLAQVCLLCLSRVGVNKHQVFRDSQ